MANPLAGEVSVRLDGEAHVCKLTLGALAELEAMLAVPSLVALAERFETGAYSGRDVILVIVAGLRGGGWRGQAEDLLSVDIEGGAVGAAQAAALLLTRAFAPPT